MPDAVNERVNRRGRENRGRFPEDLAEREAGDRRQNHVAPVGQRPRRIVQMRGAEDQRGGKERAIGEPEPLHQPVLDQRAKQQLLRNRNARERLQPEQRESGGSVGGRSERPHEAEPQAEGDQHRSDRRETDRGVDQVGAPPRQVVLHAFHFAEQEKQRERKGDRNAARGQVRDAPGAAREEVPADCELDRQPERQHREEIRPGSVLPAAEPDQRGRQARIDGHEEYEQAVPGALYQEDDREQCGQCSRNEPHGLRPAKEELLKPGLCGCGQQSQDDREEQRDQSDLHPGPVVIFPRFTPAAQGRAL